MTMGSIRSALRYLLYIMIMPQAHTVNCTGLTGPSVFAPLAETQFLLNSKLRSYSRKPFEISESFRSAHDTTEDVAGRKGTSLDEIKDHAGAMTELGHVTACLKRTSWPAFQVPK